MSKFNTNKKDCWCQPQAFTCSTHICTHTYMHKHVIPPTYNQSTHVHVRQKRMKWIFHTELNSKLSSLRSYFTYKAAHGDWSDGCSYLGSYSYFTWTSSHFRFHLFFLSDKIHRKPICAKWLKQIALFPRLRNSNISRVPHKKKKEKQGGNVLYLNFSKYMLLHLPHCNSLHVIVLEKAIKLNPYDTLERFLNFNTRLLSFLFLHSNLVT